MNQGTRFGLVVPLWFMIGLAQQQTSPGVVAARKALQHGADSSNPIHRRELALSLGLLHDGDSSTRLLNNLLSDSDVQVRVAAIGTIADLNATERSRILFNQGLHPPAEAS